MRFFTPTETRIVGIVVAAATVIAILITVAVGLSRRPAKNDGDNVFGGENPPPDITEYIVPEEFTLNGGERWYFSREPLKKWNDDQVEQFWIEPADIGIDLLQKKSAETVAAFFKEIP